MCAWETNGGGLEREGSVGYVDEADGAREGSSPGVGAAARKTFSIERPIVLRGAQQHTWRFFFPPRVVSWQPPSGGRLREETNPKWARGVGDAGGIAHRGRSVCAREGPRAVVTCSSSRGARVIGEGASRPGAAGARSVAARDLPPTPRGEDRARVAGGFARAIRRRSATRRDERDAATGPRDVPDAARAVVGRPARLGPGPRAARAVGAAEEHSRRRPGQKTQARIAPNEGAGSASSGARIAPRRRSRRTPRAH